ncbi:MAG: hypothetical protein Q9198_008915 [Flavoplaca austrocitrina]
MLMDEANVPVDTFQSILYEHCYQYIRSTTAVSLHPAVYYAHLASKRARAHDISSPGDSQETPAPLARLDMERPEATVNQGGKPEDEWIGHGFALIEKNLYYSGKTRAAQKVSELGAGYRGSSIFIFHLKSPYTISTMGISYSTAKWMAPTAFLIDFAAQQYGMLSTPNMKTIHDRNLSFFSPQPFFIAGFFFPQQLFQLAWLYRLYKLDPKKPGERGELDQMVDFVPYYSLGNLCIATWMVFWNSERLDISNIFVIINSLTQLYYITAKLPSMNTNSTSSILTHIVSKTFAGIGILDLLHNGSVAFAKDQPATTMVKALTGVGFGLASAASDWIFGGCLVYDLVALAVGQSALDGGWAKLLGAYAVGSAAIVGAKNLAR